MPEEGEPEVREAFEAVSTAWEQGPAARAVADQHFYETVVRIHRAGEGAPYTGLKPAGLDVGPVTPVALGRRANGDVAANREYVEAMLGLQVWAHKLHQCVTSPPHEAHGHGHGA